MVSATLASVSVVFCNEEDTCHSNKGERRRLLVLTHPNCVVSTPTLLLLGLQRVLRKLVVGREVCIKRITTDDRYEHTVAELLWMAETCSSN